MTTFTLDTLCGAPHKVSNAESSFMRRGPLKRPATPLSLPAELAGAIVWNFA